MSDGEIPAPLRDLLTAQGVHSSRSRDLISLLCNGFHTLDDLVVTTATPRRTVEEVLEACAYDLVREGDMMRMATDRVDMYRDLAQPAPPDTEQGELLDTVRAAVRDVPPPLPGLDHVQATPETVLRRALWLDERFHLRGAHLLFVGDHDLTSIAVCAVRDGVRATVVDVDERLLRYVDDLAAEYGLPVRTLHADLRFGFPPSLLGTADLVFTDPPYTPEGMRLFLAHGVLGLREPVAGRLIVAYGHTDRAPELGRKTQAEMLRLGLVFEAILPDFNRYDGAQAVGSASDLYVCQPTARAAGQARPTVSSGRTAIYTHGSASVESAGTPEAALDALREASAVDDVRGPDWNDPVEGDAAIDLTADPGPWLARMLLACKGDRVVALVRNNHADVRNAPGQRNLARLVGAKYALSFRRSIAGGRHALVVAERTQSSTVDVQRELLDRAHGKLANTWREALIAASGGTLTKRAAREQVLAIAPDEDDLEVRLIDLPRYRVSAILDAAAP
ncbi:uncharacterized protein DUF43 [Herbihabitans rhizosphaerae]|uniref:Uncharacterized protein DUF43 n=1 Tax=Herbihabitans rhizosphaerae TaxID=1872711 RepID=A0A4Q7KFT2_9PSEU|nr:bis-aminopropyl spermidine synthase family protein [Herbihabitans rhizosphaerae]RZS32753.1 uncharacterized protein DUF43 [Herbihabitans rhizosphaerae]